jgi:hypothetical protein
MTKKVKVTLGDSLKPVLASMLGAVEQEADARISSALALVQAATGAWQKVRDAFLPELAKDKEQADALLTALAGSCREAVEAKPEMQRGIQYASDLRRAVKLARKGIALPDALKGATRTEWNEHPVWDEAGVKGKAGAKKKDKPEAGTEEAGEAGNVGETVAKDDALSALFRVASQLQGPFRREWLKEAEMLAISILAKQKAASGSGDAAAQVTAILDAALAKPEAKGKGRKAA